MNDSFLTTSVCDSLDPRAIELRRKLVDMLLRAGRGHLASALSIIDLLRVLYDDVMTYDPKNPNFIGRDRFILSKGHACMAQYLMLAEKGFFPEEELSVFCKAGSFLGGHPEYHTVPGVEASTGSLGHGPSIGVGMAIALKADKNDSKVYVVIGDGESNEGSVWEAALSAVKNKLDNLVFILDYNKFQSYGRTVDVIDLEPLADKWVAFGWEVEQVNGHDIKQLREAFDKFPVQEGKPSILICHTIKGAGIRGVEHNLDWHHKSGLTDDEAIFLNDGIGRKNA